MRIRNLFSAFILTALVLFGSMASAQVSFRGSTEDGKPIFGVVQGIPKVDQVTIVNGQKLFGALNLEFPGAQVDPATNTIALQDAVEKAVPNKGSSSQGNTTISGSLTVTGNSFLGSGGSTYTENFGGLCINYERPAASTAITITKDVTSIQDAGADVVVTLPGTPPNNLSRRLTLYNESATYNVTDGTNVLAVPGSKIELTWINGGWK